MKYPPSGLTWSDASRCIGWCSGRTRRRVCRDLDTLGLEGVETIRVANDEYAIKNRLLHVEPEANSSSTVRVPCRRE